MHVACKFFTHDLIRQSFVLFNGFLSDSLEITQPLSKSSGNSDSANWPGTRLEITSCVYTNLNMEIFTSPLRGSVNISLWPYGW